MKFQNFIIILLSGATLYACSSVKSSKGISPDSFSNFNGEWKLKDSWVFDSTLVFERIDSLKARPDYEEVFIINQPSITHEVRTELGICGNGMFYLDSAQFLPAIDEVNLILMGGYIVESKFSYKAKYNLIESNLNRFVLMLEEVLIHESKSEYDFD